MKNKIILVCLLCFSLPVCAEYFDDTRIRTVFNNDKNITTIEFMPGQPVIVELDNDEIIEDVAVSGLDDWKNEWEINKRGHRLFVKPFVKTMKPRTVVLTTAAHSYILDLKPDSDPKTILSKIVITNKSLITAVAKPAIKDNDKIIGEPKKMRLATYKNTAYTMQIIKEQTDIHPREAWDDGKFTYLRFPKHVVIPAIYKTTPGSQEESMINSHVEKDGLVVLHGVSPAWNLRLNRSVVGVFNENYDAVGNQSANLNSPKSN